jgi:hypothetical protein
MMEGRLEKHMQRLYVLGTILRDHYAMVMHSDKNPLSRLPPAQQFQIMTYLALMWTAVFCAAFGSWYWYGQPVLAHLFMILGFVITALSFSAADPVPQRLEAQRRAARIKLTRRLPG